MYNVYGGVPLDNVGVFVLYVYRGKGSLDVYYVYCAFVFYMGRWDESSRRALSYYGCECICIICG